MEKEIKIKIEKSEIKETSVFGGIQGEGGARTLKISFDSEWSGLTKKITFFDGAMQNPVIIALTEDKKENGEYSVKIPSEPLKTGGKFTFIIDGTADGIRQRSVQRELRVKYAYPSKGTEETETITPTVAEQLTASVNSNIEKTTELSAEVEDNKTEIGTLKGRATAAEAAIALKADKTELPKKVSELENDSGYLTEHQSLEAYAKKTEVSLKADKTELSEIKSELESKKVDKATGKGLSSNDYTDEEKSKLAALPEKDVLDNTLDGYALKADAVGKKTEDGGEIFNNYDGLFINQASGDHSHAEGAGVSAGGTFSHAEGKGSNASGKSAHAEGSLTAAFGDYSHSEGDNSTAEGEASHAEGSLSRAQGNYSHAEGSGTKAVGKSSHVEGLNTVANGNEQHVQGKYNVQDNADKYAHIIGNGTSDTERSNAHTIDWDGNTWFKGVVKIGGISYEDTEAKKVATIEDIKSNLTTVYKVKGSLNPVTDSSYITDLIPNGPENGDVYNISATSDSGLSQSWQWDDDSMPEFEVIDEGTSKTLTFKDDSIVSKFRQKCGIRFKYKDSDTFDYMNCNGTGLTYDIIDSNTIDIGLWFGDIISEGTCFLKQIDTDDKVPVTKGDNVVWVEGYGWDKLAANINLFDSSSSGGLNQKIDGDSVFDFTDANPNATALDSTLTGNIAKGAIGDYAVSFGGNSAAIGKASLTEGKKTIAKGQASHAEGIKSVALGYASHSEGGVTTAGGIYSHAEGKFTVANGDSQHVQGKYNIIDSANKYAHIVGNGTDENSRSNAHTLDWNGNAWFKGDLKIGGTSYDDGETLIKKPELSKLKKQSIPQGKAEGYPAKITDGLAGESPLKLNVYGNSGKNMLKATDFYSALQKLAKGGDNILYEELEEDGRKCVRFIDNFTARYQILPFKENTQYTISMDCRTKIKTNENTIGSTLFVFFYTDGTFSDAVPLEKNTPWTHKTATSKANKTISAIGIRSRNFANWCYVDVDTFQLEEGAAATDYEAFDGVGDLNSASGKYEISVSAADYEKSISGGTLTATLDRQLSPGEYIDLIGKKLVSAVGETDITVSGELEIPETETCYISAGTEMSPEKIEAGYYQDINKVIKEMKNSILSLGGNV